MRYLYLLLLLSLFVLLWAAWAVARHIRRHSEDEYPVAQQGVLRDDGTPARISIEQDSENGRAR